jgi:hypothetical protein
MFGPDAIDLTRGCWGFSGLHVVLNLVLKSHARLGKHIHLFREVRFQEPLLERCLHLIPIAITQDAFDVIAVVAQVLLEAIREHMLEGLTKDDAFRKELSHVATSLEEVLITSLVIEGVLLHRRDDCSLRGSISSNLLEDIRVLLLQGIVIAQGMKERVAWVAVQEVTTCLGQDTDLVQSLLTSLDVSLHSTVDRFNQGVI